MSNPIADQLQRELGIVINHGEQDIDAIRRVWHNLTNRNQPEPYHSSNHPKGPPVSIADSLRTDLENLLENHRAVIERAEQDAAKVQRYESEPLIRSLVDMLETVPTARDILTPVLAGVSKLAAMSTPAEPASADPQIQTGVAQ